MVGEVLGEVMVCGCCSTGIKWEGCDRQPEQQITLVFRSTAADYCSNKPALGYRLQLPCSLSVFSRLQFIPLHQSPINRAENVSHTLLAEGAYCYEKQSEGQI